MRAVNKLQMKSKLLSPKFRIVLIVLATASVLLITISGTLTSVSSGAYTIYAVIFLVMCGVVLIAMFWGGGKYINLLRKAVKTQKELNAEHYVEAYQKYMYRVTLHYDT